MLTGGQTDWGRETGAVAKRGFLCPGGNTAQSSPGAKAESQGPLRVPLLKERPGEAHLSHSLRSGDQLWVSNRPSLNPRQALCCLQDGGLMKRRWPAKGGSHTKSVSEHGSLSGLSPRVLCWSQHGLGAPKGSQREGRRQETQDYRSQGMFPPATALPPPNTHLLPQTEVQDQAGQKL